MILSTPFLSSQRSVSMINLSRSPGQDSDINQIKKFIFTRIPYMSGHKSGRKNLLIRG